MTSVFIKGTITEVGNGADEIIRLRNLLDKRNQEKRTLTAEIKRLRDALQEVSRALGPYTRDPHEFAVGVIEDMQDIALTALVDNWADLKEQDNNANQL